MASGVSFILCVFRAVPGSSNVCGLLWVLRSSTELFVLFRCSVDVFEDLGMFRILFEIVGLLRRWLGCSDFLVILRMSSKPLWFLQCEANDVAWALLLAPRDQLLWSS